MEGSDRDPNPILFRFLSSQDCPRSSLQQMDIYVPWLDYTIREFSHCQQTTYKMINIWIQEPYSWLKCDQLVDACEGKAKIKEFLFKLWHALDKCKKKPTAAPAAFLRHTNFQFQDHLTKHQLIPTFKITFSRRFRR